MAGGCILILFFGKEKNQKKLFRLSRVISTFNEFSFTSGVPKSVCGSNALDHCLMARTRRTLVFKFSSVSLPSWSACLTACIAWGTSRQNSTTSLPAMSASASTFFPLADILTPAIFIASETIRPSKWSESRRK